MADTGLGAQPAMATICVSDAARARGFYEGQLGLRVVSFDADSGVAEYESGGSRLAIYASDENAGKNPATSATWGVGERFEAVVAALQAAGVPFLRYDFPEMERDGDVHRFGDFRAAWFHDPDGNILHVNSG